MKLGTFITPPMNQGQAVEVSYAQVDGMVIERVLLPPAHYGVLADMRAAQYCVLSRGPWPAEHKLEAIEIMWDDGSDSPFALHLTPDSFDLLPAEPEAGREWTLAVYVAKDARPHKALERRCYWRRAPHLPWMKPWKDGR
jgi:hypothetical protein